MPYRRPVKTRLSHRRGATNHLGSEAVLRDLTPPGPLNTELLTSADGQPVALHDFGGRGSPLLLSHGNGLNAGMWRACLPTLQEHFHCWGLDLRGHGATHTLSTDYDVDRERFAEDVLVAVDRLGEPVRYAAHSLGGAAGLYAARRCPEQFLGLWLYEPVVIDARLERDGPPKELVEAARRRRLDFPSADEAITNFCSKMPFSTCEPEAVRGYVELGSQATEQGVRLTCLGENEARVFGSGVPIELSSLATITCPATIGRGEATGPSHAIPASMATPIAQALPVGQLATFQGLTHFGPMESHPRVTASIVDTLG